MQLNKLHIMISCDRKQQTDQICLLPWEMGKKNIVLQWYLLKKHDITMRHVWKNLVIQWHMRKNMVLTWECLKT